MTPSSLAQPVTLPCGLVLPNRLAKAALAEQMADSECLPATAQFSNSYGAWARGGWGMILTGNVQVDLRYFGTPKDTAIDPDMPREKTLEAFKTFASTCRSNGTPALVQLNHPGRQSPLGAGKKGFFASSLAPSPVPLNFGDDVVSRVASCVIFGTPREMTVSDIEDVVQRFVYAARLVAEAGFDGIEIHVAHGYLLAQFLSPKSNLRKDAYGGSAAARAKIVIDIIKAVRAAVPATFCVGLKMNSADHQPSGDVDEFELRDCIEQAVLIAEAGIDFLEISGGSYEKPEMIEGRPAVQSQRTAARESFFLDFARELRKALPKTILMVTGGFRSRIGMEAAVAEGACDIIGIGRPAIVYPSLPLRTVLNAEIKTEDATIQVEKINPPYLVKKLPKSVGSGYESSYYSNKIQRMT